MSQPAVQFCSGQAKPMLLVAGTLGLIGSLTTVYFVLQASAFDKFTLEGHDLKLYSRLAVVFYLALFAGFTIYTAITDQKSANKFLVILALVNIGLAVGAGLTIENSVESALKNQTNASSTWTNITNNLNCCKNFTQQQQQNSSSSNATSSSATLCNECDLKIDSTIFMLVIIFTGLALINIFTLIVSGATVYKTHQYDEASQGTYS